MSKKSREFFHVFAMEWWIRIPVPGTSGFACHTTEKFLQQMQCFSIGQNAGQLIKMYSTNFVDNMVGKEVLNVKSYELKEN